MASVEETMLPPEWEHASLERQMGQLFIMGFEGTSVDSNIRSLIEEHHLGAIILTAKNLKSAEETTRLVLELQTIARDAGHPIPLLIGIDQENGGVNSLIDETHIRQFPSAMGIAATRSKTLAREVAKATAQELNAVGVNWIFGPVLDVLDNVKTQPLGVRSIGDDPLEVSAYGLEYINGYKEGGLATCGKHFPSYGNLESLTNQTDVPIITDTLDKLSTNAFVPFRDAIKGGVDAMMVGGCEMASAGMEAMHACLSEQVVDGLLRKDLNFEGVVVSECLEMEALSYNIGVGGGTVMALTAGCDILQICRTYTSQLEALNGLKSGIENSIISKDRIKESLLRVLDLKSRCTSWEKALNPESTSLLSKLQLAHLELSSKAYNSSITVVRDKNEFLPISSVMEADEELALLTPLLQPLPASAISMAIREHGRDNIPSTDPSTWDRSASVMSGESVFRDFGRSLARQRNGHVVHTSYTSTGVRPVHEQLIERVSGVIVVTCNSNINRYQHAFAKHVSLICNGPISGSQDGRSKPCIVVAVSSPYDFATDLSIGTYVCTYDFTETALQALIKVLCGEMKADGTLPGTVNHSHKSQQPRMQHWLVENFDEERDGAALDELIAAVRDDPMRGHHSELAGVTHKSFLLREPEVDEAHFVVRNSSTKALYGFCSTYFFQSNGNGAIGTFLVDPTRRKLSIGSSLHKRAIRVLNQKQGLKRLRLGSRLPGVYLGIPTGNLVERRRLRVWFANLGWDTSLSRPVCTMILENLKDWSPPGELARSVRNAEVNYDLVYGMDYAETIYDHIGTSSRQGVKEVYKMALSGPSSSGVIRAKRNEDGVLLGSIVVFNGASKLADYVPAVKNALPNAGGISAAIVSPVVGEYSTVVQGLILLGIKQLQSQGVQKVVLDCVDGDGNFDSLSEMGFSILHSFQEVSCDPATWAAVAQ